MQNDPCGSTASTGQSCLHYDSLECAGEWQLGRDQQKEDQQLRMVMGLCILMLHSICKREMALHSKMLEHKEMENSVLLCPTPMTGIHFMALGDNIPYLTTFLQPRERGLELPLHTTWEHAIGECSVSIHVTNCKLEVQRDS